MSNKFEEYEKALRQLRGISATVSGSGTINVQGVIIKISGSGRVDDQGISSSGSLAILGSISTPSLKCSGSMRVNGDVESNEISISGSGSIEGKVKAKEIRTSGSFKAMDIEVDILRSSGSLKVGNNIKAHDIRVSGSLHVIDIHSVNCTIRGSFKAKNIICDGMFNAELSGRSEASSIKAKGVIIKPKAREAKERGIRIVIFNVKVLEISRGGEEGYLNAEKIEGDEIYLENVTCNLVKGKRIEIGPNCIVERVEYSEDLKIDPSSKVKESVKV